MNAGGLQKLLFGNIPRFLLAWVSTEAVRNQSRVLVLGASLLEFMRKVVLDPIRGSTTGGWAQVEYNQAKLEELLEGLREGFIGGAAASCTKANQNFRQDFLREHIKNKKALLRTES